MDQQLKQRLIGATIIVSLIVIFAPMLVEDRSDDPPGNGSELALPEAMEEQAIELPKSAADVAAAQRKNETANSGYRVIPLDAPAPKQDAKAETGAEANADSEIVAEEEIVPDEEPAEVPELPLTPPKSTVVPPDRAGGTKPEAPARKLAQPPLKKADFAAGAAHPDSTATNLVDEGLTDVSPAEAQPPAIQGKRKPALTRTDLSRAATEKLAKVPEPLELEPTPAGKPAKVPENSAGWVVQTGSFTSEQNARSLADKLRKSSFAAFVEVGAGGAHPIYRVKVGPELDRTRAEQMRAQIENSVGIKGIILPHR